MVFPPSKTEDTLAEFRNTYARDWKYFSTDQKVEYMGHTYQGLALPRPVLRKLFHDNAVRWFPASSAARSESSTRPFWHGTWLSATPQPALYKCAPESS
jgi:hypothetical protein